MSVPNPSWNSAAAKTKLREAMDCLAALGFGSRQSNEVAGYTLLALLDLKPNVPWERASNPMRGITPIIDFVSSSYRQKYAPNTRETVRDEAVKYFVESGMVLRNPDDPSRPTNSGNTVTKSNPQRWNSSALAEPWNGQFASRAILLPALKSCEKYSVSGSWRDFL